MGQLAKSALVQFAEFVPACMQPMENFHTKPKFKQVYHKFGFYCHRIIAFQAKQL